MVGTAQVRLDVEIMNKKKTVTIINKKAHVCDGEDDDGVLQGEDQRIERRDAGVRC